MKWARKRPQDGWEFGEVRAFMCPDWVSLRKQAFALWFWTDVQIESACQFPNQFFISYIHFQSPLKPLKTAVSTVNLIASPSLQHPLLLLLLPPSTVSAINRPQCPSGDAQHQSEGDGGEDLQKWRGPRQHRTRDQPAAETLPPQHRQVTVPSCPTSYWSLGGLFNGLNSTKAKETASGFPSQHMQPLLSVSTGSTPSHTSHSHFHSFFPPHLNFTICSFGSSIYGYHRYRAV